MAQAAPIAVGDIRDSQRSALRLLQSDETRLPGRPPGQRKTGGRKPGVPNKVTRDVKEMILKRGKPLELLCDVELPLVPVLARGMSAVLLTGGADAMA